MEQIHEIRRSVAGELEAMNRIIADSLHTNHEMMDEMVSHYLKVKGKQIRPILVILTAKMFGRVSDEVLYAGAALEMLHNASLIHDDVVDETLLRRGLPTINARMGNHIAVLVGDYFVSNALDAGIRTGNVRVIAALSQLGKELSLGEIDQMNNARGRELEESSYIAMIRQKTASLFMHCVGMGADLSGASARERELMVRYAELLGLCFQIKDDIFDYYSDDSIGKPTGNDLREGKVTLPLLYALRVAPEGIARPMRDMLEAGNLSTPQIDTLIAFAKEHGGIEYAYSRMMEMQQEGEKVIEEIPEGECKNAFREIFAYIIKRTK